MDKKLKYAIIIAFAINSFLVLTAFQNRTYDSYEHVFFANHYRTSWFDTWETKWYGGFTVTSYPPLAHQTIALLSYVIGLDWAYQALTLALMTIFPLAIYALSRTFLGEEASVYAAVLSVFLPSVLQATYSFGQLPTIFALIAACFAMAYLAKFLLSGRLLPLLISLGLLGVSVSAHHFTAVFLVPLLIIVLITSILLQRKEQATTILGRGLLFSAMGVLLCFLIIFPYWFFTFFQSVKMTPIPHLSRVDILSDSLAFELFFWNAYGAFLFLIPLVFVVVWKKKNLAPLLVGAVLLFLLGLGGTTPLPKLMFGQNWEVLTFDRFSLWAGVVFLPLFGQLFADYHDRLSATKIYKLVLVIFLGTLVLTSAYAANRSFYLPNSVSISSVDPVIEFLSDPQVQEWRYITLGLGEPAMLRISVQTSVRNVDGYYFFVRSDPLLSQSGIGQLDAAKFYGKKGMTILGTVLERAPEYGLRWVICADTAYYKLLEENSFFKHWSQDLTGDNRLGGITVWEYNGSIPTYVPRLPENKSSISDYAWGIGPPLALFGTISLIGLERIKSKKERQSEGMEKLGRKEP